MLGSDSEGTSRNLSAQQGGARGEETEDQGQNRAYQKPLDDATSKREFPTSRRERGGSVETQGCQVRVRARESGGGPQIRCPRNSPQNEVRKIMNSKKGGKKEWYETKRKQAAMIKGWWRSSIGYIQVQLRPQTRYRRQPLLWGY